MKILHLRFSDIWPGQEKRYGRTDGRTYTEPRPICLPQGETYNYYKMFKCIKAIGLDVDKWDFIIGKNEKAFDNSCGIVKYYIYQ